MWAGTLSWCNLQSSAMFQRLQIAQSREQYFLGCLMSVPLNEHSFNGLYSKVLSHASHCCRWSWLEAARRGHYRRNPSGHLKEHCATGTRHFSQNILLDKPFWSFQVSDAVFPDLTQNLIVNLCSNERCIFGLFFLWHHPRGRELREHYCLPIAFSVCTVHESTFYGNARHYPMDSGTRLSDRAFINCLPSLPPNLFFSGSEST